MTASRPGAEVDPYAMALVYRGLGDTNSTLLRLVALLEAGAGASAPERRQVL